MKRRRDGLRRGLLLAAATCLALFAVLAWLALAEVTLPFDRAALGALRVAGDPGRASFPGWLLTATNLLTRFGDWPIRLTLALLVAIVLMRRERVREAAVLLLACASGAVLLPIAKQLLGRARPDLAWRLAEANDNAFPSGHAMGAMILYPLAGFMLGRMARGLSGGAFGLALGVILALAIGATRVVLGVHWISDAIGGWLIGAAWALASLTLVVRGRRQKRAGSIKDRVAAGATVGQARRDGDARD